QLSSPKIHIPAWPATHPVVVKPSRPMGVCHHTEKLFKGGWISDYGESRGRNPAICPLLVLYQSADLLTLQGFPNHRGSDSRWQTEGRLPWAMPFQCERTIRRARFAGLPNGRRTLRRLGGCWRSRRCSTGPRGKRRRRSVEWIARRCGTG